MKNKFKEHIKEFLLRGLLVMGFGPLILATVYLFLWIFGVAENITLSSLVLGNFTVTILSFICGGITVIYKVESLPLPVQIMIQALVLYLSYVTIYLVNGWLKNSWFTFIIFSVSFAVGFAIIWVIVYLSTRKSSRKLNEQINNNEK
ncbi:MAG: DUF3021 domain-containing protein [Clostridia bacterium]|nr:DUF3021 domain-containing protein [Clostridia bacterium]